MPVNSARTLGPPLSETAANAALACRLVLDTNTVLDLWAFQDPRVAGLRSRLEGGALDWVAEPAMRQELETVLVRGVAARHGAQPEAVLQAWDRHARLSSPAPTVHRMRCRDEDDQKFIDLALGMQAQWLLTSDRDLLTLARRAAVLGLKIASPYGWAERLGLQTTVQG